MVSIGGGKFRLEILSPTGVVYEGRCGSLILPVYDGSLGVLRNHTPMLCKLGMGICEVREIPNQKDKFYLLDGGFVRVSENSAVILAYDVITFEGKENEEAERLFSEARELVAGQAYIRSQWSTREVLDYEKSTLVVKMGKMSGLEAGFEKN